MALAPENKNQFPDIYPQCRNCSHIKRLFPGRVLEQAVDYFKLDPEQARISCTYRFRSPKTHFSNRDVSLKDGNVTVGFDFVVCPAEKE